MQPHRRLRADHPSLHAEAAGTHLSPQYCHYGWAHFGKSKSRARVVGVHISRIFFRSPGSIGLLPRMIRNDSTAETGLNASVYNELRGTGSLRNAWGHEELSTHQHAERRPPNIARLCAGEQFPFAQTPRVNANDARRRFADLLHCRLLLEPDYGSRRTAASLPTRALIRAEIPRSGQSRGATRPVLADYNLRIAPSSKNAQNSGCVCSRCSSFIQVAVSNAALNGFTIAAIRRRRGDA